MKTFRRITAFNLAISFFVMAYSGIMLFLCPHGRVAYWSDWHLLGLSKVQYGELHTTGMLLFLFFGAFHIYCNWKSILNYLKGKTRKVSFTKKELVIAMTINILTAVQDKFSSPFLLLK